MSVVAGGDGEAIQSVEISTQRPIGSTSSGGLTGGAGLNFAPKGSLAPTPEQQKPPTETLDEAWHRKMASRTQAEKDAEKACLNGMVGGAVAGSLGGLAGIAVGTIGGGIAGGCLNKNP